MLPSGAPGEICGLLGPQGAMRSTDTGPKRAQPRGRWSLEVSVSPAGGSRRRRSWTTSEEWFYSFPGYSCSSTCFANADGPWLGQ
jgi:hypothetical protein